MTLQLRELMDKDTCGSTLFRLYQSGAGKTFHDSNQPASSTYVRISMSKTTATAFWKMTAFGLCT